MTQEERGHDANERIDQQRSDFESLLRERGIAYQVKPDKALLIAYRTTVVQLSWYDLGDRTAVRLLVPVVVEISKITPVLSLFLAETNNDLAQTNDDVLRYSFSLDTKRNAVWFEHGLLADHLDAEELYSALAAIAATVAEYAEQISSLSGGTCFAEATNASPPAG